MLWETLFLLLPIAFASGWWSAQRTAKKRRLRLNQDWNKEYFAGLNYLLNDEPDKAIDLFVKVLDVSPETIETYLAIGSLFRRRGEVARATRIHQNLIARPNLTKSQRALALLELGRDYLSAGFFDRAEGLFKELVDTGEQVGSALRHLIDIYQQERDWHNAIEAAKLLETTTAEPMRQVIAHYHCELANLAKNRGDVGVAQDALRDALGFDRHCARAYIELGNLEVQQGRFRHAARAYKKAAQQNPRYLAEVVSPLSECYTSMGSPHEYEIYLSQAIEEQADLSVIWAYAERLRARVGEHQALGFVRRHLLNQPIVRYLATVLNPQTTSSTTREDAWRCLQALMEAVAVRKTTYRCNHCGFAAQTMHWMCPSCRTWDAMEHVGAQFLEFV